jgi:uncharacterized protein (UPF0335 family)
MSDQSAISQNNEQILLDIQMLQQMEQQLFNSLETNTTLTSQQQQQIIEKMNQLSNMRINLYKTLSDVNSFFHNALSSSVGTLEDQTAAITIVENELNQSKKRLEALEAEKNNKIRLVEINNYYSDKYAEHSELMKIIVLTLIPIIILAFLFNKGLLPNAIYLILLIIIGTIGAYFFWLKYASIIMRDNMNYQEYNWSFDPKSASTSSSTVTDDPWSIPNMPGTCIGQNCCSDGLTWDSTLNQCVVSTTPDTISESTDAFTTLESMVNNVLTKKQPGKFKYDHNM